MISLLLACSEAPAEDEPADHIALVYSANVDGEIEPCG